MNTVDEVLDLDPDQLEALLSERIDRPTLPDDLDAMTGEERLAFLERANAYTVLVKLQEAYVRGRLDGRDHSERREARRQRIRELEEETAALRRERADLEAKSIAMAEEIGYLRLQPTRNADGSWPDDPFLVRNAARSWRRDYGDWPDYLELSARLMSDLELDFDDVYHDKQVFERIGAAIRNGDVATIISVPFGEDDAAVERMLSEDDR